MDTGNNRPTGINLPAGNNSDAVDACVYIFFHPGMNNPTLLPDFIDYYRRQIQAGLDDGLNIDICLVGMINVSNFDEINSYQIGLDLVM